MTKLIERTLVSYQNSIHSTIASHSRM